MGIHTFFIHSYHISPKNPSFLLRAFAAAWLEASIAPAFLSHYSHFISSLLLLRVVRHRLC